MELKNEHRFCARLRVAPKWLLLWGGGVLVIGLSAVWFGPRAYSDWRQERLLGEAGQSLQKDDMTRAAILLRRVLLLNPDNVAATRGLAELADTYAPTEAPALRARVCKLAPTSDPDATAWALTALRAGQSAQAEEAFDLMKRIGQPSAAFHEIGGRVALACGRLDEARGHFARALEFDPAKESNQVELAAVEIRLPDPAGRERAREKLERLRANPQLRPAALRALVTDRLDRREIDAAHALARELVHDPEATFQDRLQSLAILRVKEDPSFVFTTVFDQKGGIPFGLPESREQSFASYLNDLQAEARGNAGKVAALVAFLNRRGLSLLACEWTGTMAREFVSVPPIAPPLADAYRLTLDWRRLEALIKAADWGELEFQRIAYRSRVSREKGDRAGSATEWAAAVKQTDYRYERLLALARLAFVWGWSSEFEEVLWVSVRSSQRPREALEELVSLYREKRDTAKLFTVWSGLLELDPEEVTAQKNWVRLSLLLGKERFRAGTLAQELHQQHPTDPHIVCSYAFVLHLRQQDKEALALMNSLQPEARRVPAVAGYYAIVLLANQRIDEAAEYLRLALEAALLREEQELMNQTRRALEVRAQRP